MWVTKGGNGYCTWHSAPDGENTQCGIHVPFNWKAVDIKPSGSNHHICKNCVHTQ